MDLVRGPVVLRAVRRASMRFVRIALVVTLTIPFVGSASAIPVNDPPIAFDDPALFSNAQKVLASDCATDAELGRAAAISGDTAVMGAYRDDDNGGWSGSAYVFVKGADGEWTQQAKLTPAPGYEGDTFGCSVAIDGDTIVVGAEQNDAEATDAGAAYVFTRSDSMWTQQATIVATDYASGDYFGTSVALQGDTLLVGAFYDDDTAANSGSVYVYTRSGTTWTARTKLHASDAAASDFFGCSVALDDGTAIIGAKNDDITGSNEGSAYFFTGSGDSWSEQGKVYASDYSDSALFGNAVSISGDRAVVGSVWQDTIAGTNTGAAYVFTRSLGVWSEQQELIARDAEASDYFGWSVGIDGTEILVGAPYEDTNGDGAGSVYHYSLCDGEWAQHPRISPGEFADQTGISVALDGKNAVAGANNSGAVLRGAGAAQLFSTDSGYPATEDLTLSVAAPGLLGNDYDANMNPLSVTAASDPVHGSVSTWPSGQFSYTPDSGWSGTDSFTYTISDGFGGSDTATATIEVAPANDAPVAAADGPYMRTASSTMGDAEAGDQFGNWVAIDGDTALCSAMYDDTPAGADAGSVRVMRYDHESAMWGEEAILSPPGAEANDQFGISCAISGDTAVVGAWGDDEITTDAGAVYVFTRSGNAWSFQAQLTVADMGPSNWFGASTAIDGETIVVGAHRRGVEASQAGAAYVFTRNGTAWTQQARLQAPETLEHDFFGYRVDVDGNTAVVGVRYDDTDAGTNSGSAHVFTRAGTAWSHATTLTPNDLNTEDQFGHHVAIDGETIVVGSAWDDDNGDSSGSAYVFKGSGSDWAQTAKLTADDGATQNYFGTCTAIDGKTIVVGADGHDEMGSDTGSVYVYEDQGDGWSQVDEIYCPDAAAPDHLGYSVGISGDYVLSGAAQFDAPSMFGGSLSNAGAAYLFRRNSVEQGQSLTIGGKGVLLNDTDEENDALTAVLNTGASHGNVVLEPWGAFTYTPTAGYTGPDSFTYVATDYGATSTPVAVQLAVMPTKTSSFSRMSPSTTLYAYGRSYTVTGTLMAGAVPIAGRRVVLQTSASLIGPFIDTAYVATTSAEGTFTMPALVPRDKVYYRVSYAGEEDVYRASVSGEICVEPRASMGTPKAPSTMVRSRYYTVYGYLKPKHSSGTYPVRIYKYRYVSGRWKSYGYVKARAYNYSTYTKYSVKMKLPYAGRWRLRAYAPADSRHAATWSSSYDYVRVR